MNMTELLKTHAAKVEMHLSQLMACTDTHAAQIMEAERYSLLSGGKRIRPFLVSAFSSLLGGDEKTALTLGCALEMIHTYSLIHDDLPCMDNDDLRRGRPTSHKVFGEATAVLAGDALLTHAFQVATSPEIGEKTALYATRLLSQNAGVNGMIGGQMLDMRGETEALDFETLCTLHKKKTGALIEAACLLGCYAAQRYDENDPALIAAKAYAHGIGLAFQIVDDCLDAIGSSSELGKTVGKDAAAGKTTFLSFMSTEKALLYAKSCTEDAKSSLSAMDGDTSVLCALANYLLNRNY